MFLLALRGWGGKSSVLLHAPASQPQPRAGLVPSAPKLHQGRSQLWGWGWILPLPNSPERNPRALGAQSSRRAGSRVRNNPA